MIYSVSRPGLNRILLDAAEAAPASSIRFALPPSRADFRRHCMVLRDEALGPTRGMPLRARDRRRRRGLGAAACAGRASSMCRAPKSCSSTATRNSRCRRRRTARHQIEKNALHVWPRGGFMLIALPNLDGSFTVTLFLPHQRRGQLRNRSPSRARIDAFFAEHFPDVARADARVSPTSSCSIRPASWARCAASAGRSTIELLLIGDAAHAITPFHGQGMNCAFEDCRELVQHARRERRLGERVSHASSRRAGRTPTRSRTWRSRTISRCATPCAIRNSTCSKALSLELERRFPQRFVPRYSMVMFHDEIPYARRAGARPHSEQDPHAAHAHVEHARRRRLPAARSA